MPVMSVYTLYTVAALLFRACKSTHSRVVVYGVVVTVYARHSEYPLVILPIIHKMQRHSEA